MECLTQTQIQYSETVPYSTYTCCKFRTGQVKMHGIFVHFCAMKSCHLVPKTKFRDCISLTKLDTWGSFSQRSTRHAKGVNSLELKTNEGLSCTSCRVNKIETI